MKSCLLFIRTLYVHQNGDLLHPYWFELERPMVNKTNGLWEICFISTRVGKKSFLQNSIDL